MRSHEIFTKSGARKIIYTGADLSSEQFQQYCSGTRPGNLLSDYFGSDEKIQNFYRGSQDGTPKGEFLKAYIFYDVLCELGMRGVILELDAPGSDLRSRFENAFTELLEQTKQVPHFPVPYLTDPRMRQALEDITKDFPELAAKLKQHYHFIDHQRAESPSAASSQSVPVPAA